MDYNSMAKGYNELYGEEQRAKYEFVKKLTKIKGTILDVGCGTGLFPALGLDPSIELLKQNPNPCILSNAENIPFDDKTFDIVTSFTAIHNADNWKKGVDEICRVAKKLIIITVLKKSSLHSAIVSYLKNRYNAKLYDQGVDTIAIIKKYSRKN